MVIFKWGKYCLQTMGTCYTSTVEYGNRQMLPSNGENDILTVFTRLAIVKKIPSKWDKVCAQKQQTNKQKVGMPFASCITIRIVDFSNLSQFGNSNSVQSSRPGMSTYRSNGPFLDRRFIFGDRGFIFGDRRFLSKKYVYVCIFEV